MSSLQLTVPKYANDEEEVQELLNFFRFAYIPDSNYKGTVKFEMIVKNNNNNNTIAEGGGSSSNSNSGSGDGGDDNNNDNNNVMIRTIRADPQHGVQIFQGDPPDGNITCHVTLPFETFHDVFWGYISPRAFVTSGGCQVHNWNYRELLKFGLSFDMSTQNWAKYYEWKAEHQKQPQIQTELSPSPSPSPSPSTSLLPLPEIEEQSDKKSETVNVMEIEIETSEKDERQSNIIFEKDFLQSSNLKNILLPSLLLPKKNDKHSNRTFIVPEIMHGIDWIEENNSLHSIFKSFETFLNYNGLSTFKRLMTTNGHDNDSHSSSSSSSSKNHHNYLDSHRHTVNRSKNSNNSGIGHTRLYTAMGSVPFYKNLKVDYCNTLNSVSQYPMIWKPNLVNGLKKNPNGAENEYIMNRNNIIGRERNRLKSMLNVHNRQLFVNFLSNSFYNSSAFGLEDNYYKGGIPPSFSYHPLALKRPRTNEEIRNDDIHQWIPVQHIHSAEPSSFSINRFTQRMRQKTRKLHERFEKFSNYYPTVKKEMWIHY